MPLIRLLFQFFITISFNLVVLDCPTVCVDVHWAGVDSAWEQEKLEARKMLENAAESHTSGAPQKMSEPSFFARETRAHVLTEIRHNCTSQPSVQSPAPVYSEAAGTQAVRSIGDALTKRLPWCTVVSGRIDLNIGGARIAANPLKDQDEQLDDAKRPRWES
jgi:hypothetical protein